MGGEGASVRRYLAALLRFADGRDRSTEDGCQQKSFSTIEGGGT
jgi:hypothetical protein